MINIFNAFADPTQFPDTSTMLNMQEFLRDREKINEIGLVCFYEEHMIVGCKRETVDYVLSR